MSNVGSWSFARVVAGSTCWVLVAAGLYVAWIYLHVRRFESEGAGVAHVSVGLGPIVLVLVGPPLVLFTIWVALKLWARSAV